jgi:DNA-3-methyladenine glycosylase
MYFSGGAAYVYLCYGIHHLFNVVTNVRDIPHAVLIRALEPLEGLDVMLHRRGKDKLTTALTAGPGAMSAAMGITTGLSGISLQSDLIYIDDRMFWVPDADIVESSRVGVAYAGADALLPFRFSLKGNKYVSKAKGL